MEPARKYDVHFYYGDSDRTSAREIREKMVTAFENRSVRVKELIDRPIGPHPIPMFEANFSQEMLDEVSEWLEENRKNHSVLIHPLTGDDMKDHTELAKWLGTPVVLDLSRF